MSYRKAGTTPYTPNSKKGLDLSIWTPHVLPGCRGRRQRKMFHYPEQDGLLLPWEGRVWLNPPFSILLKFCEKFVEHGDGIIILNGRSHVERE